RRSQLGLNFRIEPPGRIEAVGVYLAAWRRVRAGDRIRDKDRHLLRDEVLVITCAHQIQVLGRRRRRHVAVVLDARPARRRALLRLHQDHAVRSAAAVNRGRRRILQDRDGRDVRGIEAAGARLMCAVVLPPGVTPLAWICEPYPLRVARRRWAPAGTPLSVKWRSARVSSRYGVPAIATSTLASGCWVEASTTFPVTPPVVCCALNDTAQNRLATSAGTR